MKYSQVLYDSSQKEQLIQGPPKASLISQGEGCSLCSEGANALIVSLGKIPETKELVSKWQ